MIYFFIFFSFYLPLQFISLPYGAAEVPAKVPAEVLNKKNKASSLGNQKKVKQKLQKSYPVPSPEEQQREYEDFEEIIEGFSSPPSYRPKIFTPQEQDLLSHTIFHGSLGFNYALIYLGGIKELKGTDSEESLEPLQGLNIVFGIHLFSPFWLSEADFRFFSPLKVEEKYDIYISEFNLKLLHKPFFGKFFHLRIGLGFLSRYLTVSRQDDSSSSDEEEESRYAHPALNVFFGFEIPINSFISLSTDFEYALSLTRKEINAHSLETMVKTNIYF